MVLVQVANSQLLGATTKPAVCCTVSKQWQTLISPQAQDKTNPFSISCFNHGVLLQQPKITKIVFFITWVLKIIPALFLLCPFAFPLPSFKYPSLFFLSFLSPSSPTPPDLDFCISSLFFHPFSCLYSLTHTLHNNTCRQ